ncbi:MAG: ThuA domain-containing protein, partial [Sedimentisphaerales bacterium]|nr:ThuA domain-containing protein [Sedimentisphaerales bacterium]
IRQLAKRGAGLVFIHYAVAPPDGLEDDFLEWTGGYWDKDHSQNPINTVKVSPTLTGHPICRGWDSYVAEDEFYFAIRFRENDKRLIPIMTAMLPSRNPRKEILAWAVERKDGGRGFAFTGGHFQCNWHIEPFRKMVLNAILWSAKIEVPKNGVQSTVTWKFVSMPYFLNADIAYPQPGWEDTLDYVLKSIKAEGPEFVLVAGGLVMGRWPDKDSIKKYAAIYYPAWIKRMNDHGLAFYTAIGENEIGGSPWDGEKAKLVPTLKKRFQKYMKMPFNGPRRMKGTAFWFIHENILFIAVDVFEKGDQGRGAIVPKVTGKQLEWFNEVISNNPGLEHIVVMGHTPIHGPTKTHGSGGLLMLEKGRESPLWQAMKKHGVDIYLCGDTNAITCTQEDGILQIAHGSLFGYSPRVNYLVATVSRNKIELELKEIDIVNKGNKLRQAGDNSLYETVLITDEMKRRGYISVGKMVVEHK